MPSPFSVPRPLAIAATDGQPVSFDLVLAFPFVGVDGCPLDGVTVDMRTQALPVGAAEHSQADLPTLPTDSASGWGTVVFIRPVPRALLALRRGGSAGSR